MNLSLPIDVLDNDAAVSALPAEAFDPDTMPLDERTAADLMQRLARAKRPLVLVGPACMMLRPLQALLESHANAVLVCDGGEIGQRVMACLTAPHRVNNGVACSIGAGLAYALVARCAVPRDAPVVAVMGDGTVGFHIAEYDTAVRCAQPFVSVIGNDARWNAEYQILLRDYGAERLVGCELLPTRYDMVAQAFGAHGELVTKPQAMAGAIERAMASGLPACINVMIEGVPAPVIRR